MSTLNIEFMDDNKGYISKVEDDLEFAVVDALNGKPLENIPNDIFSHVSVLRHNIYKWYPFKKDCSILEIGAGMGAITGLFCSIAEKVVAVEKKHSRAEIINKRFAHCKNLTVINDNIFSVELNDKFDYVVIGDTFVYATKFYQSDNAHQSLINKAKSFLKEDGTILLATENKLGLKYFAGAVENYSRRFFSGLNNFKGYNFIRTMSKSELIDIFKASGFKYIKFYYPYPDHIFPLEIYTDESLQLERFGSNFKDRDLENERFSFFDEQEMFAMLQKEKIVTHFSNSFLVEASNGKNCDIPHIKFQEAEYILENRYLEQYYPRFNHSIDAVIDGDAIIHKNKNKLNRTLPIRLEENNFLKYFNTGIRPQNINYEVEEFIDNRLLEIERKYCVKILYCTTVGSTNFGLTRSNTDVDLIFTFINVKNQRLNYIRENISHGFEFEGYEFKAVTDNIRSNYAYIQNGLIPKLELLEQLDFYYYGIYSMFGAFYSRCYNGFDRNVIKNIYMPILSMCYCLIRLENIYLRINKNKNVSCFEYIFGVACVLSFRHFFNNGEPGDVNVRRLMDVYLESELKEVTEQILDTYLSTHRKHTNFSNIVSLNNYFEDNLAIMNKQIKSIICQKKYVNISEGTLMEIENYVERLKSGF